MPEPTSIISATKEAQAVWSLLRHPIQWVGRKLGVTSAPNIVLGPMANSALPDDPRATYRQGYFATTCVNEQRQDWWNRWLTTKDAFRCRGRLFVVSDGGRGHVVREDDVLFCGPAMAPRTEITLPAEDDRFHIPLLATISEWTPHHTIGGRQLQPGTYLLGARYFTGLHDHERLPVGNYALHLKLISANGSPVEWDGEPFSVEHREPLEADVVFSVPATQPAGSNWEKVNIQARASKRLGSIENMRLTLTVNGQSFPMQWSAATGDPNGASALTLHSEPDVLILVAGRCSSGAVDMLGTTLNDTRCWLTDVSFRVHKKPVQEFAVGHHVIDVSALYGTGRTTARFELSVPAPGTGPIMIRQS